MSVTKKRKLRAILFADIVGYTALMQKDEAKASELLQKFRNTLNEKVTEHAGEIINNYGDGCLCTFESAVDAMTCAKEVQLIFQTNPVVPVRIGLHSGDVFFEDDNVFGDSVNIASRIESLGVAGAVLFSKRIKRDISNQTIFKVQSLGEFDFKNVEQPMEVFALSNEGIVIPKQSEMQGKLKPTSEVNQTNFFQKLWSKKIPQIIVAYLLIAWVILQFFDRALDQFGISPYWSQIFFITIVGIIPSLVVYLNNRERIHLGQLKLGEKLLFPTNIILLGATLFFMFRTADLGATAMYVSYVNEEGVEVSETIIKEEFRKRFPVFQFDPIKADSANAWLGYYFAFGLDEKLSQNKYVSPYLQLLPADRFKQGKKYTTVEKINSSKIWKEDYYVDGQYQVNGKEYEVKLAIRNKKTGKMIQGQSFQSEDLLSLPDSMYTYLSQAIGLTKAQVEESPDLSFRERISDNIEAIKHLILGQERLGNFNIELEKAIALDSTFTAAYLIYARRLYFYNLGELEAKKAIDKAMKYRERLPFDLQIAIMVQKHIIYQEWDKAEQLLKIQLEIDPSNEVYNFQLSNIYFVTGQIEKLVKHTEKHFANNPNPNTDFQAMRALLLNGEPDKVISRVKTFLSLNQQHFGALELLAHAYLLKGDLESAQTTLEKIILLKPDVELIINKSLEAIAYLKENPIDKAYLNQFEGFYRVSVNEMIIEHRIIANQIYSNAMNQPGFFMFPAGPSTLKRGTVDRGFSDKLLFNEQGAVYGKEIITFLKEQEVRLIGWKQDSVIWNAEALLKAGNYKQAQIAYQTALEKNPEHYYLYQHQQHLEYLQSKSEEAVQQNFQRLVGQYGKVEIWEENGLLYYKRPGLTRRVFRPLSDNRFTSLLRYMSNYEFVEKNGKVVGIQGYRYNHDTKAWDKLENWYYERTELLD